MNVHLIVLVAYALGLMTIGLRLGRYVRGSADFFVAGRALGPGLIFSTMLAANIGGGSTVGATGLGYASGLAAWWWVGSAAIGSVVLAFWIGPAIRRVAAAHDLRTVGDYLEFRYSRAVRGVASVLLWIGSLAILAAQLIALGSILEVVAGVPFVIGCAIGGLVITSYYTAGGLLTAAWINVIQLTVKLGGFAIALPIALQRVGGWDALAALRVTSEPGYWSFWRPETALGLFVTIAPAFVISPGLLQKIFGARDDRAVRAGVGLNALGLFLYAGVPVVLGMAAHVMFPDIADQKLVLPTILMRALPPIIGSIGLAAVFSAEVSAADAVLFMLTTSLSQDLYKRFINPAASDGRVLQVARLTTVISGTLGVGLAIASGSIVDTLTIFYTLLTVSFFVPILAGLYIARARTPDALAAIAAGVTGMLVVQAATGGRGWGALTPALVGLVAAIAGFLIVFVMRTRETATAHEERKAREDRKEKTVRS
jgi:SSS family solute:Na+ symporter